MLEFVCEDQPGETGAYRDDFELSSRRVGWNGANIDVYMDVGLGVAGDCDTVGSGVASGMFIGHVECHGAGRRSPMWRTAMSNGPKNDVM